MSSKITQTFERLFFGSRPRFPTKESLAEGLRNEETAAIEHLMEKTEGMVRRTARSFGLPESLARDVLNDGILILIKKIQAGAFDADRAAPQTFLVAVCRNLLSNHSRLKRQPNNEPLENGLEIPDNSFAEMLEFRERWAVLQKLLAKIGQPCTDLINLKYLEGYSDEELISQKLTPFSSHDSLRVTRSKCMKKLSELAKSFKN